MSGQQIQLEDWMITSFEVQFGPKIGSGGLYDHFTPICDVSFEASGQVFKGTWNHTEVALKVFNTATGAVPSSAVSSS